VPHSRIQTSRKLGKSKTKLLISGAGTSFSPDERVSKNLTGLIPHVLESLETQCMRAMRMINSRGTNIDKYLYLSTLKQNNTDLFYRLLIDNVATLMPLVYTPTIGDVCLQYSTLYTHPEALYISIKQRKSIATILKNWPYPDPSICVVTDGSRILGLGDLGVNGVGISVSRLMKQPHSWGSLTASSRSANLPCTLVQLVSTRKKLSQLF
jgi:malate dehydrogenase (oxaloacetate-decarboxylating)(NADP+)